MSESEARWYRNPQGIVAAIAIATTVLGFFYVRERQLWEDKVAIESLETRGRDAILDFRIQMEKMQVQLNALQRGLWELDKRIETRGYPDKEEGN